MRPAPPMPRTTRPRSGSPSSRAASTWATTRSASRPWPGRSRWASSQPTPNCRRSTRSARPRPGRGPRASRSRRSTSPGRGTRFRMRRSGCLRGWPRCTRGSWRTPTTTSAASWTTWQSPASARTPWSSWCRTTGPAVRAGRTGRSTRTSCSTACPTTCRTTSRCSTNWAGRRPTTTIPTGGRWRSTPRSRCGSGMSSMAAPPTRASSPGPRPQPAPRPARASCGTSTTTRSISCRPSWTAVTTHPTISGWSDFNSDTWELYHIDTDRAELHDLAAEHPDKLRELVNLWFAEAGANQAFPLDDRSALEIFMTPRPQLTAPRNRYVYAPDTAEIPEAQAVNVRNRSYVVAAQVDLPAPGAQGVLFSHGSRFGGHSLYVKDNRLHYAYNFVGIVEQQIVAAEDLPTGDNLILSASFDKDGEEVPGVATGVLSLYHGDRKVGEGRIKTQPGGFAIAGE